MHIYRGAPGCRTERCARHVREWWAEHHQPPPAAEESGGGGSSGLARCIIEHESSGNPQAVNGQYSGIGQWSPQSWAANGGTRYAASPTEATKAQQEAVLNGEGQAGMEREQGQYDGCG